jgi:hypothetical protein
MVQALVRHGAGAQAALAAVLGVPAADIGVRDPNEDLISPRCVPRSRHSG